MSVSLKKGMKMPEVFSFQQFEGQMQTFFFYEKVKPQIVIS